MTVSLNQPTQGTADWHTPLNENFADIEFELNLGDRVFGLFFAREQSTPDMTVLVDAGAIWSGGSLTEVSSQSTSQLSAPASNDRIDRVVLNPNDGSVSVETGTEAASPSAPSIPTDRIPIAQIALSPSQTEITNSDLTDERSFAAPNEAVENLKEELTKTGKEINEGVFTPGDLKFRAVDDEQTGWLQCNGQTANRTTDSDLFAAIGTTFGNGDGSTTFNVPDYRDRAVIGMATMGAGDASRVDNYGTALGDVGGADQHQLSNAEMPSHNHGGSTGGNTASNVQALVSQSSTGQNPQSALVRTTDSTDRSWEGQYARDASNHSHSISTNGSDSAHNNMMPFGTASILIKR